MKFCFNIYSIHQKIDNFTNGSAKYNFWQIAREKLMKKQVSFFENFLNLVNLLAK